MTVIDLDAPALPAVRAAHHWRTNAELIAEVARLHLHPAMVTLDATFGLGKWWTDWTPDQLYTVDDATPAQVHADFRRLPFRRVFDLVAFDPPYKLNGTPSAPDVRYGVHRPNTRTGRQQTILDGLEGCANVLAPGGTLLVKVQDQVNGGRIRWQTLMVAVRAATLDLRLLDEFTMLGGREQPDGRGQDHARGRGSQLLVLRHDPNATRHLRALLESLEGPTATAALDLITELFS